MRQNVKTVLLVCGVIGAVAGLCRAEMQDAVEVAQVHAGVVSYPDGNPFAAFAMRLWSLQLQIPALLLHWGMSERAVSALVSAAMGVVSFQALGMTVLAFGGPTAIACAAPGVIVAFGLTRGGVVYPVLLFGDVYTWGIIGLSLTLLVMALLSAGSLRLGGFLLAMLPAMHASLGLAAWAVMALVAWATPSWRADLWSTRRWIAAGAGVTAMSLAVHWWRVPPVGADGIAAASSFTSAVLKSWDYHRQLVPVSVPHLLGAIVPVAFAAVIIWRRWLPGRAALLPVFVLITSLVGAALHTAQALPWPIVPASVLVMMPGRLINFGLLSFAAFAIGLAARHRALQSRAAVITTTVVFALIGAQFVVSEIAHAPQYWAESMIDASNDPFYARVKAGRAGLLTASDIADVQRRTRRPIVVNGAWIDAVVYAPETGTVMNRALMTLYGVDLLHPPEDSRLGYGSLPREAGRRLWESRSAAEWQQIGRDWHIDQIVTYDDWQLALPRAAADHGLALFVIPPA